jgi:hypothetical protein
MMQHDSDAAKRYCLSAADANTKYKTNGQATTCQNDGLGGKLAMQVYESKCRKSISLITDENFVSFHKNIKPFTIVEVGEGPSLNF